MYDFNYCFVPTDQTQRRRYETCIIYCSDDESLLISPKDLNSWKILLTAAAIRNHRPLLDLAEHAKEGEIPSVSYHRKYRSLLTMKRKFEKIAQTTVAGENIPESNDERGELELEDLVGKNQVRAELIRKYAFFVKRKLDLRKGQDLEML